MDYRNRMDYRNKKIIIYGNNRYQREFQNIYDDLKVEYYVDDDLSVGVNSLDTILYENPDDTFVIICKPIAEHENAIKNLTSRKLIQQKNFCLADDLFVELDIDLSMEIAGRKVVVWGTGSMAKEFYNHYKTNYPSLHIDFFVDSDPNKCGQLFYDKRIESFSHINDWSDYYVIVAIADYKYDEINKVIKEKGVTNKFISASLLLLEKPSTLLMKTFYDTNLYPEIQCSKLNDLRILKDGNICPCCMASNYIMGNVFINMPEEIWSSIYEKIFRLSLVNKTFSFCDRARCPLLVNRQEIAIEERNREKDELTMNPMPDRPYLLLLELDSSCNIMCTSCRDSIIIEENDFYDALSKTIIDHYLDCSERLILTGNGEVLVSKYGKRILASDLCKRRKKISILTNGLVFNRYHWEQYFSAYDIVDVSVSMDAACEETYERIRRKSNWRILNDNLAFIKQLKLDGKIGYFQINFVVQKNNVHEMADFVRLGKKYGVDRVLFSMLENWNYSEEEYARNSVFDKNSLIKEEYQSYFEHEILEDPIIDFTNIAQAVNKYAKNAYMY